MNEMTFAFREKALRVEMIEGDPWWVAADLCALLGIINVTNAVKKLPDDMVTLYLIKGSHNGKPVNLVSEPGMWLLVSRSDKPEAQEVVLWLCREVLPALRKYGYYQMPGFEPPLLASDLDPRRAGTAISMVREARMLFGMQAGRNLWTQLGLPAVHAIGGQASDPLAETLMMWLEGRMACTISEAADGIGLRDIDNTTRYRIGRLLKEWGWIPVNKKIARNKTARVFQRPLEEMD